MFVVKWRHEKENHWYSVCWSEKEEECDAYIMRRLMAGSTNQYRIVQKEVSQMDSQGYMQHYRDIKWSER